MAYLGRQPVIGNFVKLDAITAVNGQAAYTMQNGSANFTDYSTVNQFMVSLNGTIQSPGSSFTVSGSTLTFASNLSTGDVIDFIIVFGNSLSAGTPTDATVTTAKLAGDAVTEAKIADGAVESEHLNANIISGQTELATTPADTDEFLVSDAGTLKRIDYSLIKGGGQWEHLITSTASNSSSIDFSSTYITTTYLDYMIVFSGIKQATDNTYPRLLFSTDGGSSFVSGYMNARRGYDSGGDSISLNQSSGSSGLYFTPQAVGNATGEIFNAFSIIYDPLKQSGTTDAYTLIRTSGSYMDHDGSVTNFYTGNAYPSTTAVNGIRFDILSGNITTGKVSLYGRKIS